MIIRNGVLLSVDVSDLDENGALHVPDGVIDIDPAAGEAMDELKAIYLPNSLTDIRRPIFCNNEYLESVYFGEGVKTIDQFAFFGCPNISELQIPRHWNKIYPGLELMMQKLRYVIRRDKNGNLVKHTIKRFGGRSYFQSARRIFGNIEIIKLHNLEFDVGTGHISPSYKICLVAKENNTNRFFICNTLDAAITDYRRHLITQEFERTVWEYNAGHGINSKLEKYENILRASIKQTLCHGAHKLNSNEQKRIREHIKKLDTYISYLDAIYKKYKNASDNFQELADLDIDTLIQIIKPRNNATSVQQSCTRWLRRHPVNIRTMNVIFTAGYKNPGAFPYSWICKTPPQQRGAITQKLHKIFRNATIRLYRPDDSYKTQNPYEQEIRELAQKLSKVIGQSIEIKYLSSGNFSKTFTLQIPGDKKYVWKIYHCDRTNRMMDAYSHNTELQNSFLIGGKKYYGKTKFRKISTAGIGIQRGEIYLIYPYTEEVHTSNAYIYRPFECTRAFSLVDTNSSNFIGNTIIDLGALNINKLRWGQPKYVAKIMNTILYQSWGSLGYVLNNYTSAQIATAIDFVSERISSNEIDYEKVCKKIDFLRNKIHYCQR